jgi:hypothetical protein
MRRGFQLVLILLLVFAAGASCSPIQQFTGVEGESQETGHEQGIDVHITLENTTLGQQLESGEVTIDQLDITEEETQGEIIQVLVVNQSDEEQVVEIPAGMVFTPEDSDEQDLMVLDSVVVTLEPEEEIVLSPYVVCIDAGAAVPSSGSTYQLGYLESDDLLTFAQCVDQESNGSLTQDDIGLQFAVWAIASGGNIFEDPEFTEVEDGALSGTLGELEIMAGMMEEMVSLFGEEWLQRCNITLGE